MTEPEGRPRRLTFLPSFVSGWLPRWLTDYADLRSQTVAEFSDLPRHEVIGRGVAIALCPVPRDGDEAAKRWTHWCWQIGQGSDAEEEYAPGMNCELDHGAALVEHFQADQKMTAVVDLTAVDGLADVDDHPLKDHSDVPKRTPRRPALVQEVAKAKARREAREEAERLAQERAARAQRKRERWERDNTITVRQGSLTFAIHPSEYEGADEPWYPRAYDDDDAKRMLRAVAKGSLWLGERKLTEDEAQMVRLRLQGLGQTHRPFDPTERGPSRELIPGLWMHGTCPGLSAPKGFGKTTALMIPLAAALVIEGRRFLGFFEPAHLTPMERARDVVLGNAEHPEDDVHELLLELGLEFGYRSNGCPVYFDPTSKGPEDPTRGCLIVEHLNEEGGAISFDLTDPVKLAVQAMQLQSYRKDTDLPQTPPLALLVDGLTAILAQNTSGYGALSSALKRLMRMVDIPNGMASMHSPMSLGTLTPMQGVESSAEWDGLIVAQAGAVLIGPETSRSLHTFPRHRKLPFLRDLRLRMDPESGLVHVVDTTDPQNPSHNPSQSVRTTENGGQWSEAARRVFERLPADSEWVLTKVAVPDQDAAARRIEREALDWLVESGHVEARPYSKGRSRGTEYRRRTTDRP